MSILATVAQAITDEINNHEWTEQIVAERSYADWDIALEETEENRGRFYCDVVPVTFDRAELIDRGQIEWSVPIDVGFRQLIQDADRLPSGRIDNAVIDKLMDRVEEVYAYFVKNKRPNSLETAVIVGQDWQTAYGRTDKKTESILRIANQFTSIFRLTVEVTTGLV